MKRKNAEQYDKQNDKPRNNHGTNVLVRILAPE